MTGRWMYVVNPRSGAGTGADGLDLRLAAMDHLVTRVTEQPGDAEKWGREAVESHCECIVVAGGDGTINGVLQGIGPSSDRITLGVLPSGTGNDLARTLGIPLTPREAVDVLLAGKKVRLDLGRVTVDHKRTHYFLNASASGFSGQVGESMDADSKSFWGPISYLSAAVGTLTQLKSYPIRLSSPDGDQELDVLSIVVANGRTVAGGSPIAPWADPSDGLLDVIIVPSLSMTELAVEVPRILTGTHEESERLIVRAWKDFTIECQEEFPLNVDGEILHGQRHLHYGVLAKHLEVLVP